MIKGNDRIKQRFDWWLFVMTYVLIVAGVLFITVATFTPDKSDDIPLLNRILESRSGSWQAVFALASPFILFIVYNIQYPSLKNLTVIAYIIVIVLGVFASLTSSIRNVSAWLFIGQGRMIQPSELTKPVIILMLANRMSKSEKPMSNFKDAVMIMMIGGAPILLTLFQKETGSAIVMAGIMYCMMFFSGVDRKVMWVITIIAVIGVSAFFAYGIISGSTDYRILRLLSFIDPQKYYNSAGYQILNSRQAIGAGGVTGIGFFIPGSMSQLSYVPENWTDFIFSTIGEAVGFVGCTIIILLYVAILLRILYVARFTYDKYGRMIIVGVASMLYIHIFQNLAMTLGRMPITGIPLPFLSHGGSNFIVNVVSIALVMNVEKNRINSTETYRLSSALQKKTDTDSGLFTYYLKKRKDKKARKLLEAQNKKKN